MNQVIDEITAKNLIDAGIEKVKIRTVFNCESRRGICVRCYGCDLATGNQIKVGEAVGIIAAQSIGEPGTQLTMRTFHTGGAASEKGDITGGLTDVETIFEAPHLKKPHIANWDGIVSLSYIFNGRLSLVITNQFTKIQDQHLISGDERILVANGDKVVKGQQLTANSFDPHKYLKEAGLQKFQEELVDRVQAVYRSQGVDIHEKHIEVIARQMFGKVRITEPGDAKYVRGQEVDRSDFLEQNEWIKSKGGQTSEATPILYGITQAALRTNSFLSAASFQYTTKILAEGAVLSKRDDLLGMKEKVMTGGLIPAGTGFKSP